MSKRRRFLITSFLLPLGFIGVQALSESLKFVGIGGLAILTGLLFFWSLREGLSLDFTLTTIVLPIFFTVGVGLFWFLLPSTIYARLPVILFYGLGVYSLCLTHNIFSVGTVKTIALLRSARGVGFILSLVTAFLLFDAVLSIRPQPWFLVPLIFFVSFIIYFQGLWTGSLTGKYDRQLVLTGLVLSLGTTEIAAALFFWPVTVVVGSLFLTASVYVLLGLGQANLENRLFSQTIRDYLTVGAFVFVGMFLATHWGY